MNQEAFGWRSEWKSWFQKWGVAYIDKTTSRQILKFSY